MDPNWSPIVQQAYTRIMNRIIDDFNRQRDEEKRALIERVRQQFRVEEPNMTEEQIDELIEPRIAEINEMISMAETAISVDTSSLLVEASTADGETGNGNDEIEEAKNDNADKADNANDDKAGKEAENEDINENVNANENEPVNVGELVESVRPEMLTETVRARPLKRFRRDLTYRIPRTSKVTLRYLRELMGSPKEGLRSQAKDDQPLIPKQLDPVRFQGYSSSSESETDSIDQPGTSTPKKQRKSASSEDEGPRGPAGLVAANAVEDDDSLAGLEEEVALDSTTGDTITDDITDCTFSSKSCGAEKSNDVSNEENEISKAISKDTSKDEGEITSDSEKDDSEKDDSEKEEGEITPSDEEIRYGADDTRDGGPYETERVHMSDSQLEEMRRDQEDERVMVHYPEIYWCAWCGRPNSIINDVPIAGRRTSIDTSREEFDQVDESRHIYPVGFTENDVDYARTNNSGLPTYDQVFGGRIPMRNYQEVGPPLIYSPVYPPQYGPNLLREDASDDDI